VGNYQKALYIAQQVDNLWTICLNNYMKKIENEGRQISLSAAGLPEKDREEILNRVMVLFICCDIIESATIDMNDVLRRTDKTASITTFDDLRQTLSLAKEKLKYLQDKGIEEWRIRRFAKGDKVQPFDIPEDNRVCICYVYDPDNPVPQEFTY
jgi:hypothetical protein